MPKFKVSETQVVAWSGVFEARDADHARELFLDGIEPDEAEHNDVQDSYGLAVEAVEEE